MSGRGREGGFFGGEVIFGGFGEIEGIIGYVKFFVGIFSCYFFRSFKRWC